MSTIQYVNKYFVLVEDDGTVKMLFDLREPIKNYSQIPMLYDDTKDINAFKVINKLQSDHIKYYGDDHLFEGDALKGSVVYIYERGSENTVENGDDVFRPSLDSRITVKRMDCTKKSDIIDYGQWEEHISTVKGLLKDKGTKEDLFKELVKIKYF